MLSKKLHHIGHALIFTLFSKKKFFSGISVFLTVSSTFSHSFHPSHLLSHLVLAWGEPLWSLSGQSQMHPLQMAVKLGWACMLNEVEQKSTQRWVVCLMGLNDRLLSWNPTLWESCWREILRAKEKRGYGSLWNGPAVMQNHPLTFKFAHFDIGNWFYIHATSYCVGVTFF